MQKLFTAGALVLALGLAACDPRDFCNAAAFGWDVYSHNQHYLDVADNDKRIIEKAYDIGVKVCAKKGIEIPPRVVPQT